MPTLFDISAGGTSPRIFRGITTATLAPITPPGGDPYFSYVSLLLHFDYFSVPDAIAFWKLDNLLDSSGNDNTLVNHDGVSFVLGKFGNAASFDGSNFLGMDGNQSPLFNPSGTFSVSFWAYPTTLYNYGAFISGGSNTFYGFNIHTSSDGTLYFNNAQSGDCSVSNVFAENTWHHMVCMKDGPNNALIVYKNGVEIYNQEASQSYGTQFDRITIGGFRYSTGGSIAQAQIGKIDSVGLWNRLLTEEEIGVLYNSGNGLEP